MKLQTPMVQLSCLLVFLFFLSSCSPQTTEPEATPPVAPPAPVVKAEKQNQLPVQYQKPSYMVDMDSTDELDKAVSDSSIKVGASIRSTRGPQPLWDILKRLASLKKMSVSWASDVDQYVLVDVDINANDDFYVAIDNLLRQVDYYHEMKGSTIVVKYKETRQFHIAMPYTKQLYETATGGNILGSEDDSSDIKGTIRLDSRGNEFDIWENIKLNLDTIMDKWSYRRTAQDTKKGATKTIGVGQEASRGFQTGQGQDFQTDAENSTNETGHVQKTAGLGYYIIDQHLGLISVTAPRPIMEKVDEYFTSLKKSIYKQISIEAKIIEVNLNDHSSIGLNWNMLLKNLSLANGQAYAGSTRSKTTTNDSNSSDTWTSTYDNTGIITNNAVGTAASSGLSAATIISNNLFEGIGGAIELASFSFDSFLNAVKEQGRTTILSNPKLSVLNGQPALLTVGRSVTYIDQIVANVQKDTPTTYTPTTARILSGVGLALTANIMENNEIILNLVPVTSQMEEPIQYELVSGGRIGLPIVNIREMSTTVRVKDGEMLVIGGLITSSDTEEGTFIPGTSNIPFFKYLFGYEEKTVGKRELIILLKPRIM